MSPKRKSRHTWLFSFTDVAFLLLLVWTQLARINSPDRAVAEMELPAPAVADNPALSPLKAGDDYRQVLVDRHSERPYSVARIVGGKEFARSSPMTLEELRAALQSVSRERDAVRPVIVPLPESFSSDLLKAAALVGNLWEGKQGAVVHVERSGGGA